MSLFRARTDTGGFLAEIRRRICLQAGHDCGRDDRQTEQPADRFLADAVIDEYRAGEDAGFPASSISRFGLAHPVMILIPGPIRAVSSKVKSKLACSIR